MFKKTVQETTSNRGRHLALRRIAWLEGGGEAGMRAATNYAVRCLALGGKWTFFDDWTQQLKFYYLENEYKEDLVKAWSTCQAWSHGPSSAQSEPATAEASSSTSVVAAQPKHQPRAKATSSKKGEQQNEKPPAGQSPIDIKKRKASTEMQQTLSKARKTKQDYNSTIAQTTQILDNIKCDPTWKWASHADSNGDLVVATAALDEAMHRDLLRNMQSHAQLLLT